MSLFKSLYFNDGFLKWIFFGNGLVVWLWILLEWVVFEVVFFFVCCKFFGFFWKFLVVLCIMVEYGFVIVMCLMSVENCVEDEILFGFVIIVVKIDEGDDGDFEVFILIVFVLSCCCCCSRSFCFWDLFWVSFEDDMVGWIVILDF